MRLVIIISVFILVNYNALAQFSAPKYSNEFLAIGVGARGLAMSNAQTAVSSDVTSAYWNPAGLLEIKNKYELALMHSEYFAGIAKYDYGGFATQIDSNSILALSVIRFGVDDIPNTLDFYDTDGNGNRFFNYNKIKFFSISDYAFLLSYARRSNFFPGLKLGANFKVIHRNVGIFANAWGFGIDGGAQYETKKGWKFGVMARDVTSTFNAWSFNTTTFDTAFVATGNTIPVSSIELTLPRWIVGVGKYFLIKKKFGILFSADLDFTFDGKRNVVVRTGLVSMDPRAGFEFDYQKKIYLRGGVGNIQYLKDFDGSTYASLQPNFGLGVKIHMLTLDYALTNIGGISEALYSNVFSLKVAFK